MNQHAGNPRLEVCFWFAISMSLENKAVTPGVDHLTGLASGTSCGILLAAGVKPDRLSSDIPSCESFLEKVYHGAP